MNPTIDWHPVCGSTPLNAGLHGWMLTVSRLALLLHEAIECLLTLLRNTCKILIWTMHIRGTEY